MLGLSDRESDGGAHVLLQHISESFFQKCHHRVEQLVKSCLLVLHTVVM